MKRFHHHIISLYGLLGNCRAFAYLFAVALCLGTTNVYAQNMSINDDGSDPAASAMLDISDASRGLLMPRLTQAQITSIVSPATGLILYNTTDSVFQYFNGALWLNAGAAGQDLSFVSPFVSISGGTPADITNILYKEHRLPDTLGVHLMSGNLVTDGNWINGDEDDEGIFVNFGGQVGIGNNAPTQLLDVAGIAEIDSLRINNTYALPTADGTIGQVMTTNGAGITSWGTGIPDLDWTTGTGTVFNALDKVGMGTITPNLTYNLTLNSNAAGVGTTRGGLLIQNAVNGNRRKVGILSTMSSGGNQAKFGHWSSIVGANPGNDTLASFYSIINNNNVVDTAYGLYSRFVDTEGQNYGVYSTGEDHNYFSGNVGIGTNNPTSSLSIASGNLVNIDVLGSNTSGTWLSLGNSSVGGKYYQLISSGSTNAEGPGKLLFGVGDLANTVQNVSMVLDSHQLGIGTATPQTTLHLQSTSAEFRMQDAGSVPLSGGNIAVMGFMDSQTSSHQASIVIERDGASSGAGDVGTSIKFRTTSDGTATNTDRMIIKEDGNVGIGTTSPLAKFSLVGTRSLNFSTTAIGGGNPIHNLDIGDSASVVRLTGGGANPDITGISGGYDGRLVLLINVSANDITLVDNTAGSIAANRFRTPNTSDLKLDPFGTVTIIYSATDNRWFVIQ